MDFRTGYIDDKLPLVTIAVSSYNYAQYIEAALDSLLPQTYPCIELIIIDDCSVDDCPKLIEAWIQRNNLHCRYIRHSKNEGIIRTSNEMVQLARGKYISLFATDDIMLPEKIEQQVALLESHDDTYGMCYANVQIMDEEGNDLGIYDSKNKSVEGNVLEAFVFGDLQFATPSALIRKSVYEEVGFYDERVLLEDYNFWLRLFAKFKALYCSYPCIIYRIKKESAIYSAWMKNNQERYYHDRIVSNVQVLNLINNKRVKSHLIKKTSQYMKSLGATRSVYFDTLFKFLLKNGFYKLPFKTYAAQKLKKVVGLFV